MSNYIDEQEKTQRTFILAIAAVALTFISAVLIYNMVHPQAPQTDASTVADYCYRQGGIPSLSGGNVTCTK